MKNQRWMLLLLIFFLVGRLGLAIVIAGNEEAAMSPDSYGYISLADNLVYHGQYHIDGDTNIDLFRTPGYPVFLALIFWIFGKHLWIVALIQLGLSSLTAWVVYLIGRRWLQPGIGLIAGMLLAVLPNTAAWSLLSLSETLFTLLIVYGLYLLLDIIENPRAGTAVILGVVLGSAILVRPIGLLLAPVWLAAMILYSYGSKAVWERMKLALISLCVVATMLLPWMFRNASVWGTFTLSTVSKWNLTYYIAPRVLVEADGIELEEAREIVEVSSIPTAGETSASWDIVLARPRATLKVWLRSIAETLFGYGRTNLSDFWGEPYDIGRALSLWRQGQVNRWLDSLAEPGQIGSLVIMVVLLGLPLAVLGLAVVGGAAGWLAGGRSRLVAMFCVLTILVLLLPVIAVGNARFRVPLDPFLVMLAGLAIQRFLSRQAVSQKSGAIELE